MLLAFVVTLMDGKVTGFWLIFFGWAIGTAIGAVLARRAPADPTLIIKLVSLAVVLLTFVTIQRIVRFIFTDSLALILDWPGRFYCLNRSTLVDQLGWLTGSSWLSIRQRISWTK